MTHARIESRIDAVTVYHRGARVRRVAELAAGPVPESIEIPGLPLALEDRSVRVRVEGLGGAVPVAGDVRVALTVPPRDAALAPPEDEEMIEARFAEAAAADRVTTCEAELARLDHLAIARRPPGEDGKPPAPPPVDSRLALLELRRSREAALRS